MKSKLLLFLLFLVVLFFIFSQIQIKNTGPAKKNEPDFILENSTTKHYINGQLKFKVQARRIEIQKKKFLLTDAIVSFNNGVTIEADQMEADLKKSQIIARDHVILLSNNLQYTGSLITYLITEKKFFGYNDGKITIKPRKKL
ncbi:MAG: hypothetical protein PHV30_03970 [Candidatus Margulisbacteria bacterium]|nr:hypothetical protein [Candidatus Margulisiibacteriota bacterium]